MSDHIFDLDRTFFTKNVSFAFYFFLLKRGGVAIKTLPRVISIFFLYSFKRLSLENLHGQIFRCVLKGLRLSDLEVAADRFLSNCEHRVRRSIYCALQEAKLAGHNTFLLSSSPDFLVSRVAKKFSFDMSAGTNYRVDKEGRLCEISTLITGPKKKEIAIQWTKNASHVVAYSDSFDDVSLLCWASEPIAVQPDRELKKIARQRHWKIL